MKSAPSAPPAPDPTQTAQAQTQSNLQTAIANAELNRVNQQTPWGSINYQITGKNPDGTPIYSSAIQLSPAQQQLLEQQQNMASSRNSMAQQIMGQQGGRITAPLNFSALAPIVNHGQTYNGAVNANPIPLGQQFTNQVLNGPNANPLTQQTPIMQQLLAALKPYLQQPAAATPPAPMPQPPIGGQPTAPVGGGAASPPNPWGPNALDPATAARLLSQGG